MPAFFLGANAAGGRVVGPGARAAPRELGASPADVTTAALAEAAALGAALAVEAVRVPLVTGAPGCTADLAALAPWRASAGPRACQAIKLPNANRAAARPAKSRLLLRRSGNTTLASASSVAEPSVWSVPSGLLDGNAGRLLAAR